MARSHAAITRPSASTASTLLTDTRGVAQLEYVIVLGLVAVGMSLALIVVGTRLLAFFHYQEALLLLPIP